MAQKKELQKLQQFENTSHFLKKQYQTNFIVMKTKKYCGIQQEILDTVRTGSGNP